MSKSIDRRDFLRKVLIGGTGIALTPPLLGQTGLTKILAQDKSKTESVNGIVFGGYEFDEEAWIRKTQEIDESSKLKGEGLWYGDQVINPFFRPHNISSWNYVGSMRLRDSLIKETDISGIKGSDYFYLLDLNGDGTLDNLDEELFQKVMSGQLDPPPSDWNRMNKLQKIRWFEKMVENYDDTVRGGVTNQENPFTCGEFASKFMLRFAGLEKAEEYGDFDYFNSLFNGSLLEENGKINLPIYMAHTMAKVPGGLQDHVLNAIFVGENPLDFKEWYFHEPQIARRVYPGESSIDENNEVKIDRLCYNAARGEFNYAEMPLVRFVPEGDGNYSLKWKHPDIKTNRGDLTDIKEVKNSRDLIGNPYPSHVQSGEEVNIPYNFGQPENAEVNVIDMLGRRVYNSQEKMSNKDKIIIPSEVTSKLAKGLYNVTINNRTGRETVRFTKL